MAEPADFDSRVRTPGAVFLATTPNPRNPDWNRKNYWHRALNNLFHAYNGICAYCASWTYRNEATVDHFVPKSVMPTQAYEWSNYRLSRRRLNGNKGNYQDVLDPFTLAPGWFRLDFRTFRLVPNPTLSSVDYDRVVNSINRLQLNSDNDYVNERIGAIRKYVTGGATLTDLDRRYPFIAAEMRDQDFDKKYLPQVKATFMKRQII